MLCSYWESTNRGCTKGILFHLSQCGERDGVTFTFRGGSFLSICLVVEYGHFRLFDMDRSPVAFRPAFDNPRDSRYGRLKPAAPAIGRPHVPSLEEFERRRQDG